MSQKADKEGFVVSYLYPKRSWNLIPTGDDESYVRVVLDKVRNAKRVDPARIYIVGVGDGGQIAHRVAAMLSDQVAAVAVANGTIGGIARDDGRLILPPPPSQPVPALIIHGKNATGIPYEGGYGSQSYIRYAPVADAVAFWAKYNRTSNTAKEILHRGNVIHETWEGGPNGAEVQLYTLLKGAWWPGANDFSQKDDVSATDVIWDFFLKHKKL